MADLVLGTKYYQHLLNFFPFQHLKDRANVKVLEPNCIFTHIPTKTQKFPAYPCSYLLNFTWSVLMSCSALLSSETWQLLFSSHLPSTFFMTFQKCWCWACCDASVGAPRGIAVEGKIVKNLCSTFQLLRSIPCVLTISLYLPSLWGILKQPLRFWMFFWSNNTVPNLILW